MWANFDESWPFQPLNPGCPTSITPFLSSQPLPPAIAAPDYINMFSRSSVRRVIKPWNLRSEIVSYPFGVCFAQTRLRPLHEK